jgi:hypothetical protein
MITVFDYIFYRWFRLYAKKDDDPKMSASVIVSAYQLLTVINLVLLGSIILGYEYPGESYLYFLIILFYVINYFRYERGFDISELDARWGDEPENKKRVYLVLVIAYLIVTFLTPWIYGFATN